MRMDFNVLWVEDQIGAVATTRERIEYLVKKEGFRLKVIFSPSIEGAKEYLSDDIYGDHIDLVLMDLDLGAGGKGDQGLVEVRNIFPYKDIVFYSSQATDLLNLVAEKKVQGVFCSTRDGLADTVDGVFDALVKKVLDIDHSRGIVMGATSDIDHLINDCLDIIFSVEDEAQHSAALVIVKDQTQKKRVDFDKSLERVESVQKVADLMKLHHIYTSSDRLSLLRKVLKKDEAHSGSAEAIKTYRDKVLKIRNDLAHVRVRVEGFSRKLFDRNDIELTNEQMKLLRQELLRYQDLFEELSEKLKPSSQQIQ